MNRVILLLVLLLSGVARVEAGKILGGSINWKEIGKDTFMIEIDMLRDCNGIQLGPQRIWLSSNCGTLRINTTRSYLGDITPVCPGKCTRCSSSSCNYSRGIQKYRFSAVFVGTQWRQNGCNEVSISYQDGNRGNGITTGAQARGFFIEGKLDLNNPCDVSWTPNNAFVAIVGRDYVNQFGLVRSGNGDSVVYSLTRARQSATLLTNYKIPYAYDKPLYFLGFPKTTLNAPRGFHLDSNNGTLVFRPMKKEGTVIVMRAEVYRNGTRIAESVNDFVVFADSIVNNNPPVLSGMECKDPKPTNFELQACVGQNLCFNICSSDKDKDDTVKLRVVDSIPGATFTILNKGDRRERASFCWTPDSSHVRTQPYRLVVEAYDDACPAIAMTRRVYEIDVKPRMEVSITAKNKGCGEVEYVATNVDSAYMAWGNWYLDGQYLKSVKGFRTKDTLSVDYKKAGTKHIKLQYMHPGRCIYEVKDSIKLLGDFIQLRLSNDTTVCAGSDIKLRANASNITGPLTINWSTGASFSSPKSDITLNDLTTDSLITVSYSDGQCSKLQDVAVVVNHPNFTNLKPAYGYCPDDSSVIKLESLPVDSMDRDTMLSYIWFNASMNQIQTGDSISLVDTGVYFLKSTDSLGCVSWDTTIISRYPKLVAPVIADSGFCYGQLDTLKFTKPKNMVFDYFQGYSAISDSQFIGQFRPSLEYLRFRDTVKGCVDSAIYHIIDHSQQHSVKLLSNTCYHDTVLLESNLQGGTWRIKNTSLKQNSIRFVPSDYFTQYHGIVSYLTYDTQDCRHNFDTLIQFNPHPASGFKVPDSVNLNEVFTVTPTLNDSQLYKYDWIVGNPEFKAYQGVTPQMSIDSIGHFPIELSITNRATGCSSIKNKVKYVRVVRSISIPETEIDFSVYPNPFDAFLTLRFENDQKRVVRMVNSIGEVLMERQVDEAVVNLTLDTLPNGSYLMLVSTDESIQYIKVVK